jgi:iron complex transport system substrate-binding protein
MKRFFRPGFFSFLFFLCASAYGLPPKRVVSLLPSHTVFLDSLGAGELLVGVSDAENKATLPSLPRVGGLGLNWEVLVSLKPDLILADVAHKRHDRNFKRLGLPVLYLPSTLAETAEDVFSLIEQVGAALELSEKARRVAEDLQGRLKRVESSLPKAQGPKVYFEIWPRPPQACGPGSLQGNLLKRAGAENILPESSNLMPLVSLEWVPEKAPEVILHTGVVSSREIMARPGWEGVPAVRNRRVCVVDRDLFSRAGPRIVDAFEELVRLLYEPGVP